MFIGRHEIWPADWVGIGLAVTAVALFWLARALSRTPGLI